MSVRFAQAGPASSWQQVARANMAFGHSLQARKSLPAASVDMLQFGRTQARYPAFLIPPDTGPIVIVSGLYGHKNSIQHLADYLEQRGYDTHPAAAHGVYSGKKTEESARWLLSEIDNVRIAKVKSLITPLVADLQKAEPSEQPELIRETLKLDGSPLGKATAAAVQRLLMTPDPGSGRSFHQSLQALSAHARFTQSQPKPESESLYPLTAKALRNLGQWIREELSGDKSGYPDSVIDRTAHQVLDRLAPRVTLIGFSLGGNVSSLATLEKRGDIGLLITLAARNNGGGHIPPAGQQFKHLYGPLWPFYEAVTGSMATASLSPFMPALPEVLSGSPQIHRIQNTPLAPETTAISVSTLMDGLVRPRDARFNEDNPGFINIVTEPRKAKLDALMPSYMKLTAEMMRMNPFLQGFSYHCGMLGPENLDFYWPKNGNMLKQLLGQTDELTEQTAVTKEKGHRKEEVLAELGIRHDLGAVEPVRRIRRLLDTQNYAPVRKQVMILLDEHLQTKLRTLREIRKHECHAERAKSMASELSRYLALKGDVEGIVAEKLPFEDSNDKQAGHLLKTLAQIEALTTAANAGDGLPGEKLQLRA